MFNGLQNIFVSSRYTSNAARGTQRPICPRPSVGESFLQSSMINWLIDWSIDRFMGRLIDWLIDLLLIIEQYVLFVIYIFSFLQVIEAGLDSSSHYMHFINTVFTAQKMVPFSFTPMSLATSYRRRLFNFLSFSIYVEEYQNWRLHLGRGLHPAPTGRGFDRRHVRQSGPSRQYCASVECKRWEQWCRFFPLVMERDYCAKCYQSFRYF